MHAVGVAVAKSKLGESLDEFVHGEEIVVTRRGKPVARLVAAAPGFDREKACQAIAVILEASKGLTLGGWKIKDLVGEGRP